MGQPHQQGCKDQRTIHICLILKEKVEHQVQGQERMLVLYPTPHQMQDPLKLLEPATMNASPMMVGSRPWMHGALRRTAGLLHLAPSGPGLQALAPGSLAEPPCQTWCSLLPHRCASHFRRPP